jgi:hypothetical protein
VLCLAFGAFSLLAFFEVRGSIHSAVDEGLRDRAADIQELLERQWPPEQVKHELAEGSSVRGEDDILQIAETRGEWAYSSVSALRYGLQIVRPAKPGEKFQFSTVYSKRMPLRILNGQLRVAGKNYDVQIAAPMDDFYDAVNRFRLVLLLSVPVLVLVASAGGYWLSRKAVAPVAARGRTMENARAVTRCTAPERGCHPQASRATRLPGEETARHPA